MGGVAFNYLIKPGSNPVTQFQDSFNRADQPQFMGNAWNSQICANSAISGSQLGIDVAVAAGIGCTVGGGGLNARIYFTPAFVDRTAITAKMQTRGQFAEFKMTGPNVAGISDAVGPMVYNPNPNDENGYFHLLDSANNNVRVFRGMVQLALLTAVAFVWALNDVIRIEVTPGSSSNTVRSYQNGVLRDTVVDNNALRPQGGGHYGIAYFGSNLGQLTFQNFSGGLL